MFLFVGEVSNKQYIYLFRDDGDGVANNDYNDNGDRDNHQ